MEVEREGGSPPTLFGFSAGSLSIERKEFHAWILDGKIRISERYRKGERDVLLSLAQASWCLDSSQWLGSQSFGSVLKGSSISVAMRRNGQGSFFKVQVHQEFIFVPLGRNGSAIKGFMRLLENAIDLHRKANQRHISMEEPPPQALSPPALFPRQNQPPSFGSLEFSPPRLHASRESSYRSYAQVARNGTQYPALPPLPPNSHQLLLERISLLEEELSFLRAHLRLETSFSKSLLHLASLEADLCPSKAVCPSSLVKKPPDRPIEDDPVAAMPANMNTTCCASEPIRDISLFEHIGQQGFCASDNNSNYLPDALDKVESNGTENDNESNSEQSEAFTDQLSQSSLADHEINWNSSEGLRVVYWHNGEGNFTHPASGMRYDPESNVYYCFVSPNIEESRGLFYTPVNGEFMLAQDGALAEANKVILKANDWDRSYIYKEKCIGHIPNLVELFRAKIEESKAH